MLTRLWNAHLGILDRTLFSMVRLKHSTFEIQQWYITLVMIAMVIGLAIFNLFAGKHMALAVIIFAVFHFLAVIPIVTVLLALTPRKQSPREVFAHITDYGGGWPMLGFTFMVGQISSLFIVLGILQLSTPVTTERADDFHRL